MYTSSKLSLCSRGRENRAARARYTFNLMQFRQAILSEGWGRVISICLQNWSWHRTRICAHVPAITSLRLLTHEVLISRQLQPHLCWGFTLKNQLCLIFSKITMLIPSLTVLVDQEQTLRICQRSLSCGWLTSFLIMDFGILVERVICLLMFLLFNSKIKSVIILLNGDNIALTYHDIIPSD